MSQALHYNYPTQHLSNTLLTFLLTGGLRTGKMWTQLVLRTIHLAGDAEFIKRPETLHRSVGNVNPMR